MSKLSDQADLLSGVQQSVEDMGARAVPTRDGLEELRDRLIALTGDAPVTTAAHEKVDDVVLDLGVVHAEVEDMLGLVETLRFGGTYVPGAGIGLSGAGGSVEANFDVVLGELSAVRSTAADAVLLAHAAADQANDVAHTAEAYAGDGELARRAHLLADTVRTITDRLTKIAGDLDDATALAHQAKHGPGAGVTGSGGTGPPPAPVPPAGWDAPRSTESPNPPDRASIQLTAPRWVHIINGDATGGGHRHGTGQPGKTEFPARWNDPMTRAYVLATARNPQRVEYAPAIGRRPEGWRCFGTHDGVEIAAVVRADGSIWTAFPRPGGRGVVRNPRRTT